MNKIAQYSARHDAYRIVQKQLEDEQAKLIEWLKPKVYRHLYNAWAVLNKHNAGRPKEEQVWPSEYAYAVFKPEKLRITGISSTSVELTYSDSTTSRSYTFPLKSLSLSVWDFNSQVRSAIRREVKKNRDARMAEYQKRAQALRDSVKRSSTALEELEARIAKEVERA